MEFKVTKIKKQFDRLCCKATISVIEEGKVVAKSIRAKIIFDWISEERMMVKYIKAEFKLYTWMELPLEMFSRRNLADIEYLSTQKPAFGKSPRYVELD